MIVTYIKTMSNSIRFLSVGGKVSCLSEYEIRWAINKRSPFQIENKWNPVANSDDDLLRVLSITRSKWMQDRKTEESEDEKGDDGRVGGPYEEDEMNKKPPAIIPVVGNKTLTNTTERNRDETEKTNEWNITSNTRKRQRRMFYKSPRIKGIGKLFSDIAKHPNFDIAQTDESDPDVWAQMRIGQVKKHGCTNLKEMMQQIVDLKEKFKWKKEEVSNIMVHALEGIEEYYNNKAEYENSG